MLPEMLETPDQPFQTLERNRDEQVGQEDR